MYFANKLHVVTAISNPCRYASRYSLYRNFAKHVTDAGGILWTVEAAFGDRPHFVTSPSNPHNLQLRTSHELWHKENLLNLAIARLPADWEYVAWIDADVQFSRADWVHETVEQLQHFRIVQMFSEAIDLSPAHEPFMRHRGFARCLWDGIAKPPAAESYKPDGYGYYGTLEAGKGYTWHPGFAWAARRETIDALGGLIDWAPLGAADNHMAKAFVGDGKYSCHPDVHPNYLAKVLRWQERATQYIRRDVGYVDGLLLHHWHGKKRDRRYWDRWRILVNAGFDPDADLKRDSQGLWQLTERSIALRDGLRLYFRQRHEDSIDFDESEKAMA